MRPVALSDECLDVEDAEEHRIFDKDCINYGRSKASLRNRPVYSMDDNMLDEEEFAEEDIDDLLAIFDLGYRS